MTPAPLIAVLTCERTSGNYLPETLRRIDEQGGRGLERRVFIDGPPSAAEATRRRLSRMRVSGDWTVTSLGHHALGSTEATRRVFTEAARAERDLLFFEDDLLMCRNAVARMAAFSVPPTVALVSFFDMKEIRPGAATGLYRCAPTGANGRGFWGNQCFLLPAEIACWLVDQDWQSTSYGGTRMASDVIMGELLARHPTRARVAFHIPCLVEHIGHGSACFPGLDLARWRRATNFPGAEFNAASLPVMV